MAGKIIADTIETGAGADISTSYVVNGSAKAWVNLNQTSFGTLESFSVSSASDVGAGRATANLTSAMNSGDFAVSVGGFIEAFAQHSVGWSSTASSYEVWASNGSTAYSDTREITGVAMGDLA